MHFRHEQVGKYPRWIASLLVPVVLGFALDSRNPTAFVGIGIGQDNLFVQPYLGVQPAIAVRWILPMVLLEQQDVAQKALFFARRLRKMFFSKRRNCSSGCPLSCKEASPEFLRIVP